MPRAAYWLSVPLLIAAVLLLTLCGETRKQTTWESALQTWTEQAWAQHASTYEALLAEPRHADPTGRLRYAWATELPETLDDAGPLLVEMLVDEERDEDARRDALDVIAHVARTTDDRLEEFLLQGSLADSGNGAATRRLCARALARIARPDIAPDPVLDALEADVAAGDRKLARLHLETVSRVGSQLATAPEQDAVTAALRLMDGLPDLVDLTYVVQRVALLGGPAASEWVITHLNDQADAEENVWGVDVAGRLDYSDALGVYLVAAMEGTQPAFHDDVVSRRQGVNAFRSLVARYATGDPFDRKVLGALKARLLTVSEVDFTSDPRLAQAFQDLQQELDDALGE